MKDACLVIAGSLGMMIAIVHGYLGEMKVVRPIEGSPASAKRILQAIMFLSAVYWFVGSAFLVASPFYFDASGRLLTAILVGAIYLTAAIANYWATRGKHFGWILLVIAFILTGLGAVSAETI
ncbi:MAG: hypothetical protein K9G33_10950 [Sneathiella sp.]|nr:hypothetical protein [Sneathiella sp.]